MGTDEITSCVIHPGIGIARVGNSCTEYFIGPEVPWASPVPTGGYKDASGAVKRQAARFRIYGLNSAGEVVKEITAEDAQITWRVHVANSKAAWYHFNTALDIPEAQPTPRRNPAYAGPQRAKLIVDPGAREITGCGQSAAFDTGTFLEIAVPLGEIRTDDEGRLLVLGGFGGAFTPWPSNLPSTSSDNEAWCDDVSDGPVSAKVTLKQGGTFEPYPAWVIVAPPDYAPQIPSIVTLYDVVRDTLQQWLLQRAGHAGSTPLGLAAPPPVSFTDDIYPIFARLCRHQWVNYAFFVEYGWGSPTDLTGGCGSVASGGQLRAAGRVQESAVRTVPEPCLFDMRAARNSTPLRRRDGCSEARPGSGSRSRPLSTACCSNGRRSDSSATGSRIPRGPGRSTTCRLPNSRRRSIARRSTAALADRSTRAAKPPGSCGSRPFTISSAGCASVQPDSRRRTTATC